MLSDLVGQMDVVLVDDLIDTAGTVASAKQALIKMGAKDEIYLAATHAVFSDPAVSRLKEVGFTEVVVSNSIPLPKEKQFKGLKILSVAPLLSQIISNVHEAKPVSDVM